MSSDQNIMLTALRLARRGLGNVWPNPAVGCVIVSAAENGGQVLGRGWTQPGGRPHAETVALDQARAQFGAAALVGAQVFVTLEPCSHTGRTPPCADALIDAGVGRVVIACEDPDPRVSGSGTDRLKAAGLQDTLVEIRDRWDDLLVDLFFGDLLKILQASAANGSDQELGNLGI